MPTQTEPAILRFAATMSAAQSAALGMTSTNRAPPCGLSSTHTRPPLIIDRTNGAVLAEFSNVGGSDEVWFNPGDNRYYLGEAALQNLGVIDAGTLGFVGEVQAGLASHSVAADLASNHVFVPIGGPDPACPNGCVAVYSSLNLDQKGMSRLH